MMVQECRSIIEKQDRKISFDTIYCNFNPYLDIGGQGQKVSVRSPR